MEEITANFNLEETEEITAAFKINVSPSKMSELENDIGYVTKDEVITPDIDLSNLATKEDLDTKANDGDVVHKDGTEVINGAKTFNSAVNFIGSGDSNSVGISENTRFNVHNTNKTILGMGNGLFYINHGDYRLRLRGKDARPHYNTDSNYLALLSDIPNTSNLATKTEVMQMIASIPQFALKVVTELPTTGEKMTLYLVPKEGTNNDVYDEYIWIEETASFEHLGTTAVDLTDYAEKFELTAPLQYVYDGNIGSAYVFMGTDEITTDEVKATSIQLLKSGDIFTGEYSNFEPDKAWEVSVKGLLLNSSPSTTVTLLGIRPTDGGAEINVNENSQVKFYCNFGSGTATSATGATLSVNTPYDFRISYDGAGKTTFQYKQSSSTTWTTGATRTATLKANSGGSNYNYVRVGNEYTTFLLSNVEFISNNNVLFKHVAESTKYLGMALDENTVKVVDGKLTTSTKILVTTQSDYDALATKEANTLYLIEE